MNSGFILTNEALCYERGELITSGWGQSTEDWQKILDKEIETILLKDENKNLKKDELEMLFCDNSDDYVKKELSKYLENIKDLDGNAIDFNSLSKKEQGFIIEFLKQPLEDVNIYCKGAYISDIKIDLNDTFYIQADIHTIDGKNLSSAANFISKNKLDYKKYDPLDFMDFDRDYKFLFTTEKNLSTEERKDFLNKIQNSDFKDLENLDAFINIALFQVLDDGTTSSFPAYFNNNLKLDYAKATENVKKLEKDKKNTTNSSDPTLLKILWNNIKADLEKLKDFNKLKLEEESTFMQQKDHSTLLKNLLK
ncbi:hypothetical protein [Campylobacter aviculae]|uniref:Uncharacterized protein n=1 Tax=Campylobacter aviculae TaxID=2510190 RepID=A0A4U7BGA3_9BACT|nr:hypothetical protein [Campylobacter aviculae]TKX30733.1 hypothetical protein CQA76_07500 [Campylobacter aviculae]